MDKKLKYEALIKQMTLEEKASLMSGANFWNSKSIPRLNIPSIMLTDGPHGLRKQGGKADHLGLNKSMPATCFPTAATLANSWDTKLIKEVGFWLGVEAAAEDVSVLLGPGLNIKRNPLCGRNFEYFSEDPYLSGKMAAAFVEGVQKTGVAACPKHFAVNSQETHRMSMDEIVDKRALHEIYLEGFRYAVAAGAKTIMTSYNKVNGTYANENEYLLQDILQDMWGFDGLIITDWGGNNDRVAGLIAGNVLEMPSTNGMTDKDIVDAVKSGTTNEALLDLRVDSLLTLVFDTLPKKNKPQFTFNRHHENAIEAACRCIVLLKNQDSILPLTKDSGKIGIIGDFAKTPRYQGAGSSLINPTRLDNALDALKESSLNIIGYQQGFKRLGGKNEGLLKKATELAKASDIVLLFLGLDEGIEAEGVDRKNMRISDNQLYLFEKLAAINSNIVLVLSGGSPVEMPFVNRTKAIVASYLAGQGSGKAIAKILTGERNPSGKLAETYPIEYADVPNASYYPGKELTAEHRESIYVGYRYYDTAEVDVLFPFGHGISYTEYEYSQLDVKNDTVSLTVKNTGKRAGEEIVQIYVSSVASLVFRPQKELKGFAKIRILPNESKKISIKLDDHAFAYFHTGEERWVSEGGEYVIMAGASSKDIRLSTTVSISGEDIQPPYDKEALSEYYKAHVKNVTDEQFTRLLGYKPPKANWDRKKVLGINDIIAQGKTAGAFGVLVYKLIRLSSKLMRLLNRPIAANNVLFVMDLPFRSVARMSGGRVNMKMLDGLLLMFNGKFFKGLWRFIKEMMSK